jgi:Holliday junction resolvase-like predicted endonuclease
VKLGRRGEELAAAELVRCGYEIVTRNWHCQAGEVAKQQRMIDVALTYLGEHDLGDVDWRVGLVAVEMNRAGRLLRVEVYDSIW